MRIFSKEVARLRAKRLALVLFALFFVLALAACSQTLYPHSVARADASSEPIEDVLATPSAEPSNEPSESVSAEPSAAPSETPSVEPSEQPSDEPSTEPSEMPSGEPTGEVSGEPTEEVSVEPSAAPSETPSVEPTWEASGEPSEEVSGEPSTEPSVAPTGEPTESPSVEPSVAPSTEPTTEPTATPSAKPKTGTYVPIIKLHHLVRDGEDYNDETITESKFASILATLRAYGYETISVAELIAYENGSGTLPEKPVMITFDDGYKSNYEIAYPLLQQYNAKAVISVIGWSVGRNSFLDDENPIIPHFSWAAAEEMVQSGLVEITSHSYNLHGNSAYPGEDGRYGIQRFEGESDEDYFNALVQDLGKMQLLIEEKTGAKNKLFCYPYGKIDSTSERALNQVGVVVSLTSVEGMNHIRPDKGLRKLKRYDVMEQTDLHELLQSWNKFFD